MMFFKEKKHISKIPGFVYLTTVSGGPEADIVKNLLEANDIPVFIEYESLKNIYGFTMNGMGNVDIFVPENKKNTANKILNEHKE